MSTVAPPLNMAQLNTRLEEASRDLGVPTARVRRMLCTLIVSQMLPDAVAIKGGMGVKLRLGERGTRATADLYLTVLVSCFGDSPCIADDWVEWQSQGHL